MTHPEPPTGVTRPSVLFVLNPEKENRVVSAGDVQEPVVVVPVVSVVERHVPAEPAAIVEHVPVVLPVAVHLTA